MKLIPLSQSGKHAGLYSAMVDDEDYGFLMQWKWKVIIRLHLRYALRMGWNGKNEKRPIIPMHRLIVGPSE